jgi:N-acyl-L-homoserine lactone synthetase
MTVIDFTILPRSTSVLPNIPLPRPSVFLNVYNEVEKCLHMLAREFYVEIANTKMTIEEAYRLRYQTYCIERRYEESETGLERDEFDHRSRHVLLRHRPTGEAVGTVRLVLPTPDAPHESLPMLRICGSCLSLPLPFHSTAEISRFAVPKRSKEIGGPTASLMRLGLMRGLVQLSHELRLTHWCAMMERSLLRLLETTAVYFQAAGPLVAHRGLRQPSYGHISEILNRMRDEQPAVWDFITEGGNFTATHAVPVS